MAEGKQDGPLVEEEGAVGSGVDPDTSFSKDQPVVRPKATQVAGPSGEETHGPVGHTGLGEMWQSPAVRRETVLRRQQPRLRPTPPEWRERRVVGDEEEEWSYSTAPGQYTMDVLRDRFGEAGYRGPPTWPRESSSAGSSQFHLSGSRFRLTPAGSVPVADGPATGVLAAPSQAAWMGPPGGETWVPPPVPAGVAAGARVPAGAMDAAQAGPQPAGMWAPGVWGPPPLPIAFDGDPDRLAMFLSHTISHLDRYAQWYPSQWAMVVAITAGLQGEAAAWAADLYSDHARELTDAGRFLEALHSRFEDASRLRRAEAEALSLRQDGRPVAEYVREFRRLAGRLCSSWPERLLVHHFRAGLDPDLRQACVYRGVANRLQEWFRVAVDLDTGLKEFPQGGLGPSRPQRPAVKPREADRAQPTDPVRPVAQPPGSAFRCFRCNQPGHRAAECPAPTPRRPGGATPMKGPENTRAVRQMRTPATPHKAEVDEDVTASVQYQAAGDDGPDDVLVDPMVSAPISPFVFPVTLTNPRTGEQKGCTALVDTGCTRCLISRGVAQKHGFRLHRLGQPVRFEQVDGSLLGGVPATHVTELVRMDLGAHWELIRFIVVPSMTEAVILGLAWLDKWEPTIRWVGGYRRLRLALGPHPLGPDHPRDNHSQDNRGGASGNGVAQALEGGDPLPFPEEYADLAEVFSEAECNQLPPHRSTDCAVEIVPGAKLPKPRMYAMAPRELEELRRYVDLNLERGFIQPARSRVAAPVLFKEKKDGSLRLCVDFRGLNAVCVEHLYPLPLMKDMLAQLGKGRIFTKLDLREAYYRVRIKAGDEWKTAFNCPLGSFQFRVMPFGLQGAPAVFMQLINQVLHEHLYRGVLVYLDDILIYSATLEEHVVLVRQVLQKLLDAKLYVKLSKCEFHRTRLDYLGYRVSGSGVEMDPHKVTAVLEWQAPTTRRQLQSFLGFANFYRQFIPSFAAVVHPLTELLRTKHLVSKPRPGQIVNWTMECQKAFEELKALFAREPVLLHPDPDLPFVVQVDASDVAVGGVLLQ